MQALDEWEGKNGFESWWSESEDKMDIKISEVRLKEGKFIPHDKVGKILSIT